MRLCYEMRFILLLLLLLLLLLACFVFLQGTSANSSVLDAAVRRLEPRVRFIVNNSNSADDIVDQAMMHAADLKNQSDYLKG